jgi:4a-hydroxytetrahydrobiopterin dehydratase
MGFVNAIAWIAESEGHHPDLEVGYGKVNVRWSTHAVGGLTENDFICAAKVDRLLD